jgi:hypothetical protein
VSARAGDTAPTYRAEACGRCGGTGAYRWGTAYGIAEGACYSCGGTGRSQRRVRTDAAGVAAREKRQARTAAKREQAARERAEQRAAFQRETRERYPDLCATLAHVAPDDRTYSPAVRDIAQRLREGGGLTENQAALCVRALADREAREAERQAAPAWVEGRHTVEGEVVGSKWTESQFGRANKWTLRLDDGRRLFVSAPSPFFISEENPRQAGGDLNPSRLAIGARVRMTVAVTPSPTDPAFAFGKRPTKAEVLA